MGRLTWVSVWPTHLAQVRQAPTDAVVGGGRQLPFLPRPVFNQRQHPMCSVSTRQASLPDSLPIQHGVELVSRLPYLCHENR